MTMIVIAMVLVSLGEGVGLALLIPLLGAMGVGGGAASPGRISLAVRDIFANVGLPFELWSVLLVFVGVVAAENSVRFFQRRYTRRLQGDLSVALRVELYEAYLAARWPFWLSKHMGHMASRLTVEGGRVEAAFYYVILLLSESIFVVFLLGLAFVMSWQLATYFLIAGSLMFVALRGRFRAADRQGTAASAQSNDIQEVVQEHLGAAKFIKASHGERRSLAEVRTVFKTLADTEVVGNAQNFAMNAILQIAIAVILAIGLYLSLMWFKLDIASVLVVLVVFYRMAPKLATIQQMNHGLQMAAPAFVNVMEDLDAARAASETEGRGEPAPAMTTGIRLEHVSVEYPGRAPVIGDLSLTIEAERTTAFVGGSGAGKTTLMDLLLRLIEPTSGQILVDGVCLSTVDIHAWRARIGYVAQETILFHDTVAANISWAKPDATPAEIEEAARMANADEFISRMPEGYGTVVGHRGIRLSGGERQRLALARALIVKPRLLILDEATSNLDAESERLVQSAIDGLRSRMSIVVVAHRLSTVRNADRIYVLEGGAIVEQGSWAELLERKGRFSSLWSLLGGGADV